jgi:hypothetical protein
MQVKRRHEAMMMARTELHRRKLSQQGSDAVSDTEQKEALREAQRKLHMAEEKVETVKRLIPIFHHAMSDYISHATPLADHLSGGIDKSLTSLARMIDSLEAYLAVAPPTAPPVDTAGGDSGPGMTSARAGGSAAEAAENQDETEAPDTQVEAPMAAPADAPARARGETPAYASPDSTQNLESIT